MRVCTTGSFKRVTEACGSGDLFFFVGLENVMAQFMDVAFAHERLAPVQVEEVAHAQDHH